MTTEPKDPASPPPGRARRGLAAALAAFMEDRNIFWGELVGALLIIGCSTALVVSLWETLGENPLFKFCTFIGTNAAVFGAGLYTQRKWKLESTSRGLLIIAMLLVPLNILAMTLPHEGVVPPAMELAIQAASVLILTWLVSRAASVLVPEGPWLVSIGVVGTAASQLLINRLINDTTAEGQYLLVGLLPVLCYALPLAGYCFSAGRRLPFQVKDAGALFCFLGVATFSLILTMGFLVYQKQDIATALAFTSLLVALSGLPIITAGLLIHRGLADEKKAATYRMAGTSIALAGMVILLIAVGLAWPRPVPVLAVCVLNFAALTIVAFRGRFPLAHALALPCLTVAYLVVYYLATGLLPLTGHDGQFPSITIELISSAETGTLLVILFLVCGAAAELLAWAGNEEQGKYYAVASVALILVSLSLVTRHGLDEPIRAIGVYAVYGVGALAMNLRWRRLEGTYLGLILLTTATVWGLWWKYEQIVPAWSAVLAVDALVMVIVAAVLSRWLPGEESASKEDTEDASQAIEPFLPQLGAFRNPLLLMSQWLGWGGLGLAAWLVWTAQASAWEPALCITAACLAALWTTLAILQQGVFQARLASWFTLAAIVLVAGWAAPHLDIADRAALIALCLAVASGLLTAVALLTGGNWRVLSSAWQEAAALSVLPTLFLTALSFTWPFHSLTCAFLAGAVLALAWTNQSALRTWFGSTLLLGGAIHALVWGLADYQIPHPWVLACLAHSTMALLASLALKRIVGSERVFVLPLSQASLVSSFLVLPRLWALSDGSLVPLTLDPKQASYPVPSRGRLISCLVRTVSGTRGKWPLRERVFRLA